MPGLAPSQWHFDIDRYLDPILPPSPLSRLPRPAAHFLGYRDGSKPQAKLGNIPMVFSAFVGVFCSIIVIERVTHEVAFFRDNGAPLITGSFGAAAVLEFYAIESPLAQPRNAIFGQIISSLVGTAICKLFALSPNFESIRWLGGALACACATAAMALTGTVHPPAGATALLAVVDDSAVQLGWVLLPVVMLGCALMLCVALLVNNIQRRFPVYWWSPEELGRLWRSKATEISTLEDGGKAEAQLEPHPTHHSTATLREEEGEARITIVRGLVVVPDNLYLTPEEKLLLESLGQRL